MKTFLGIGCGPIQTGIFLSFAHESGQFDRLVVSEVDAELVAAVRPTRTLTLNVASTTDVRAETIPHVELLDPTCPDDQATLDAAVAQADELATALPSVTVFAHIAPLLAKGFDRDPDRPRLVYAAENHNRAAELLAESVSKHARHKHVNTRYLNTVVGKMSRVVADDEFDEIGVAPLTPGMRRAHLVETFNTILISRTHGIDRGLHQLIEKDDLLPFEEAKLYGHNAVHAAIGFLAAERGLPFMFETADVEDIIPFAEQLFLQECGAALCKKWQGTDEMFSEDGFRQYALDLLTRIPNRGLRDTVERICRDPARKLGWDDRIVGTMRLIRSQGFEPTRMSRIAALAAKTLCGGLDPDTVRKTLEGLWPAPWAQAQQNILQDILT